MAEGLFFVLRSTVFIALLLFATVAIAIFVFGQPWNFEYHPVETQHTLSEATRSEIATKGRYPVRFLAALRDDRLRLGRFSASNSVLGDVVLTRAQSNSDGLFSKFNANVSLVNATYLHKFPEHLLEPLTARNFVKLARGAAESHSYFFYDAPLSEDFGGDVLSLFPPGVVVDGTGDNSFLTIASVGSTFRGHYSGMSYFIAQMSGKSRVILFKPKDIDLLHPFPKYHPNYGFVQSHLGDVHTSLDHLVEHLLYFSDTRKAVAFETQLLAGDVLYVPPYWTHEVVYLNTSVQVRIATSSYEGDTLHQIQNMGFAVGNVELLTIFILRKAVTDIVSNALGFANLPIDAKEARVSAFLKRHLINSRLAPLYTRFNSIASSTNFTQCQVYRTQADPATEQQVTTFMQDQLNEVTKIFEQLRDGLADDGAVRDIILADYIELYVHKAIGADDAWAFFANCFDLGITNVYAVDGPPAPDTVPTDDKFYFGLPDEQRGNLRRDL